MMQLVYTLSFYDQGLGATMDTTKITVTLPKDKRRTLADSWRS
jgi:hypothetical protein